MRSQVEGDGQPLLSAGKVRAIEGVGLLGGRETGVLAHRPGSIGVHRRPRSARVGRDSRHRMQVADAGEIGRRVQRLDRYAFRARPGQFVKRFAAQFLCRPGFPGGLVVGCADGVLRFFTSLDYTARHQCPSGGRPSGRRSPSHRTTATTQAAPATRQIHHGSPYPDGIRPRTTAMPPTASAYGSCVCTCCR